VQPRRRGHSADAEEEDRASGVLAHKGIGLRRLTPHVVGASGSESQEREGTGPMGKIVQTETISNKRRRGHGEGTITQLPDGRWQARVDFGYVGGKRKRKALYGKTRQEVARKLAKALADQQDGRLITGRDQTFGQFLASWLADSVKPSVRSKTHEGYARQVRVHIGPALGKVPLTKLTAQHLQTFYRLQLDKGQAASSVNRQHAIIHRALARAARWDLVVRNVADLVDPPRPEHKEMQSLTAEQVRTFLASAGESRYHALFVLAVATGMRQSELLGLRWVDVDLDRATVRVRQQLVYVPKVGFSFTEPKTAKGRRAIVLPAFAVEVLRQHRGKQLAERLQAYVWEDYDLVFPNELGKPEERGNLVRRHFLPVLAKAGLPRIRFHDLRHTSATLLLSQNVHPKVVQERLGHSTVAVTLNVYSHVLPPMQQEAAEQLERLLVHP
jgi:integrase